ncbi:diguanylate cyclase domain-containing protein [Sulfurirhabdus autotrophica]|uniref:Diguanylate cyclase (GGDEF)-like protein n=1 Tax=Sulfurirhabdus autotrophica TaxID=1706046 RepID=A0A4R3Y1N8_9PROT|nr:diguanylate cyclase [Sulfurirhabdus autotrophica]TCV84134.1 diguanylate cyclase (GGDEF)-like protein [Sulfurirhabdus autotrophica]
MELKSKNLFGAILLFIVLDLSILVINYWITYQISKDAIAINLSGRQRMLSQSMTKSLLMLQSQHSVELIRATHEEFRDSVSVFDETLLAFKHGGLTVNSDGEIIRLSRVDSFPEAGLIDQTIQIWRPMHELLLPYMTGSLDMPEQLIIQLREQMIHNNLQILDLMNRLTSGLERQSLQRANTLRIIQTIVFFLALFNFLFIVRKFHLLARQSAMKTQHYNELAMRDPLTELFNRRQFESNLEKEVATVDRHQHSNIALVMIDLDGFKPINDKYGHEVGDVVLCTIATRLSEGARVNDTVARVGGDEFMLICPDLHNKEDADAFCQRLLTELSQPILTNVGQVSVGASIGIAFYPDHADNINDLTRMADKAMYTAKSFGKNRYVCLDPTRIDVKPG